MSTSRVSTDKPEFEIIDQFYIDVELNPTNLTVGFHEIYRTEIPGLGAENISAKFYCRTNYTAVFEGELMRETPIPLFYAASGSPASIFPSYYIEDSTVVFGYDVIVDEAPDTPYSTAFFQGFIFKV